MGAESSAAPGTRRKTALDTRTVIAADLPVGQIDARSNIPAYMPLDVLSARMIIPRDMPVNKLDIGGLPSYVPLAVLGEHVAVPKDAVLPQTIAVRQPMQHAAEMPEVLDPDVLTTGEVNLMTGTPRNLRDEAKWVLRGASAVLHATALLILFLIPSLFTSRQPTPDEIIAASHSLGDLYMPPDLRSALRPTPPADPGSNKHSHRSKSYSAVDSSRANTRAQVRSAGAGDCARATERNAGDAATSGRAAAATGETAANAGTDSRGSAADSTRLDSAKHVHRTHAFASHQ